MKDENYIHIAGWMIKRENLSGNELLCYALIYGFSQDGGWCESSHQYIADWLNVSKRTVISTIQSLVDKNKIQKEVYEKNNIKFCKYRALISPVVKKFHGGGEESSLGGGEDSSPNNIDIDNNKENNNTPLTPQGGEQGSLFPDEEEPKKSETKTKKLKKPTVEEVTEYCRKIEFQIDAEDFIDYYDSVGWVVGKTAKPMKDWKAAVRTWKRNRQTNTRINQTNDTDVYEYDTNGNKIKKQDWQ